MSFFRRGIAHLQRQQFWSLGVGLTIVLILLWIGSQLFGETSPLQGNTLAFWTNVATETLGVIITIAVINQFIIIREKRQLRKRLVRQAASPSQAIATEAIAQLREEGWLVGNNGLLRGASLRGANLKGANLEHANLEGTDLFLADLSDANLSHAKLRGARVEEADLQRCRLFQADCSHSIFDRSNLENALPWETDFTGARLQNTNFKQTNMPMANFTDADLSQAVLDGSNLKSTQFVRTNLTATSFIGTIMYHAKVIDPGYGSVHVGFPDDKYYFTRLPNGDAVSLYEDMESFISNLPEHHQEELRDLKFVRVQDVDFEPFTSSSHPDHDPNVSVIWKKQEWRRANSMPDAVV